jgi:ribosomal protein S18 acetylase RimI-like enzyme
MEIRAAGEADWPPMWRIVQPILRAGETYALDPLISEADARAYWTAADKESFVVQEQGLIVGTYYIRPNQGGGGAHVCNCGYITAAEAAGRGIGREMCLHSLEHARRQGFRAMQFNFVVSTNRRAVRLWETLGFVIVGRLPLAFLHPHLGYVDALVMYQRL